MIYDYIVIGSGFGGSVASLRLAENGVVDKNLKVHGYPDFYITDGSVIQGNMGVNPSLTITAMAEYCLDNIPVKEGAAVSDISKQLILLEEEWKKKRLA